MDPLLIVAAVLGGVLVLTLLPALFRAAFGEMVRWERGRFTTGLKVLRVLYWGATLVAYLALLWVVFDAYPDAVGEDGFGEGVMVGTVGFFIAAGGGYRLALRLGYLVTGEESYDDEVRRSEDRTELRLDDRDRS